jgi:hypothetical protein
MLPTFGRLRARAKADYEYEYDDEHEEESITSTITSTSTRRKQGSGFNPERLLGGSFPFDSRSLGCLPFNIVRVAALGGIGYAGCGRIFAPYAQGCVSVTLFRQGGWK